MSMTSVMSRLCGVRGRVRTAGVFPVRYDVFSDRYVCRSGRHDAEEEAELACACGPPAAGAPPYGPVRIPRPRRPVR